MTHNHATSRPVEALSYSRRALNHHAVDGHHSAEVISTHQEPSWPGYTSAGGPLRCHGARGRCDGAGRRRGDEKQRSRDVREQRKGARTGVDSAGIQSACSLN
ncbi:hypothetical protein OH76DRAFT_55469 [Lentinus brumalis]|uniref:Uncharacterized protein n=1 Tax=Lentinus brumalis TaxID=2498619 RepID=A0A371DYL9_9APHY|nr:hypothetical protein OH76DRAFT_55469 [Polyporus brumalis]